MADKKFRCAFVPHITRYDFSNLLLMSERLVFVTNGYEEESKIAQAVHMVMSNYDPSQDVIVPVGRAPINVLMGVYAYAASVRHRAPHMYIALFKEGEYHTIKVSFDMILVQEENPHGISV